MGKKLRYYFPATDDKARIKRIWAKRFSSGGFCVRRRSKGLMSVAKGARLLKLEAA